MYGYSIIIVDATFDPPICEAYHPMVKGIGFQFTEFSPMGYPLKVEIMLKMNETTVSPNFEVPAYPCETRTLQIGKKQDGTPIMSTEYIRDKPLPGQRGFFALRTRGNIKGIQGLPKHLSLVHPVIWQYKILEAYVPFAQKMGMWFPFFGLAKNTPTNQEKISAQWDKQPDYDKLMIGDAEDAVAYIGPTQAAFDPMQILEWINSLIAKGTQMNKLMLEGDPAGYLSASETAINNFEANIKEEQTYRRTQFLPAWIALGADDDCAFQDPSKPTFISLMEGLKAMRDAFDGLVEPEDIVAKYNEYLENNGVESSLRAVPKEERMAQMQQQFGGNDNGGSNTQDTSN
jgi:hypothetical protein